MLTIKLFEGVTDPRRAQGQRYEFVPFLTMLLLAVLSGATSYRKIAAFIEVHCARLNALFGISWKETPSYVAIRHLLMGLRETDIEQAVRRQGRYLAGTEIQGSSRRFIAIDGKALRGSAERLEDQRAQQILSVFGHADRIVLGQCEVSDKTNEIPVAQQIIQDLGLSGCVLTRDALHCQKNLRGSLGAGGGCTDAGQGQPT